MVEGQFINQKFMSSKQLCYIEKNRVSETFISYKGYRTFF